MKIDKNLFMLMLYAAYHSHIYLLFFMQCALCLVCLAYQSNNNNNEVAIKSHENFISMSE